MNQPINKFGPGNPNIVNAFKPKSEGVMAGRVNPATVAKFQKGFQKLKDGDGDGVPDVLEAIMGEARQQFGGLGLRPRFSNIQACQEGRETLIKRPSVPLRINNNNLAIFTTSGIMAQLIASNTWNNAPAAAALSVSNNARTLLSRAADPNQFYSQAQGAYLRYIKPHIKVRATRAGEPLDKDLSEMVRGLIMDNLVVVLDVDGKGKNLALAPVYFSHLPNRGLVLDKDQVFPFGDNSVLRFDYNGAGEQGGSDSSYRLSDITPAAAFNVSVEIGFDIVISRGPNDDVSDLIEQVVGLA
jgi:hypothetical protein